MNRICVFTLLGFMLTATIHTVVGQQLSTLRVVAPGAALKKVDGVFAFSEGPAVNKRGDIYFTDQPNDKIWKYDIHGKLSLFMDKTGRSNGLYFDRQGNLISCADEKDELWSIRPDKKVTVLLSDFEGKRLNGPNDLWIDPKGGIYFTDPYYQRDYWDRIQPDIPGQKVYYLPQGKRQPVIVEDSVVKPNGIVGTPDGKYLYVADIQANKTYRYAIGQDGSLQDRQEFVPQGSDGMTLDSEGNLYITGRGVTIYDNKGKKLGNIPVSANWTGNVCFGGKDRKTLFITASESVYTLRMLVKGVE
ncbi:SMP-30/gluconolactonase/LRE family protein [Chitinophaga pinensis]|uniref:SMP-30/Gluconolaconase/LRE domain protein n=1 Tax=Chitinophaga pinensis (strain ATCC 43595 / DSM 2588 / LMG 13176 / NBRC 15968 / NCIMB 11800 / UQM 2034) TaxID=485918 RepID=A0A979GYS5_CHIPD|nr:SMP-30/gluconolactonase/LRE family protein [Chitinophaga pinensis]ACU63439.1 SMP-30/Gluconolaconase/LRE domain protein [Chitinophaga pinensis DSM 2588]